MADLNPLDAIVSIWSQSVGAGGNFLGSGAFVSPRFVLTAKHVVTRKQPKQIFLGLVVGQHQVPVRKIHRCPNKTFDIALLELDKEFDNQCCIPAHREPTDFDSKTVELYAINPDGNRGRDPIGSYRLSWNSRSKNYLFPHQQRKGHSGGVAVFESRVIGVITERHREDQQGILVPLSLVDEWLATLLPDSSPIINVSPPPASVQQAHSEFTGEVRKRVARMLRRPVLSPLSEVMQEYLAEQDRLGEQPVDLLIPPSDIPFDFETSFNALYETAEDCLQQLGEKGFRDIDKVAEGISDTFGWLLLLTVSENWIQQQLDPSAVIASTPEQEVISGKKQRQLQRVEKTKERLKLAEEKHDLLQQHRIVETRPEEKLRLRHEIEAAKRDCEEVEQDLDEQEERLQKADTREIDDDKRADQAKQQYRQLLNTKFIALPVETEVGVDVVISRLNQQQAGVRLIDDVDVRSLKKVNLDNLELGLEGTADGAVLTEIKKLVWNAVHKTNKAPDKFRKNIEDDDLKETLRMFQRKGSSYYIPIHEQRYQSHRNMVRLFATLNTELPDLGLFLIGCVSGEQALIISEGRLRAKVRGFLQMLRDYE